MNLLRPFIASMICLFALQLWSQPFDQKFQVSTIEDDILDAYLAPDGSSVFLTTEDQYYLFSGQGRQLATAEYMNKAKGAVETAAFLAGAELGSRIRSISFDEGTGYMVLEDEILILLDYTAGVNKITAIELSTGKTLWETEEYRYTPDLQNQAQRVALGLVTQELAMRSMGAAVGAMGLNAGLAVTAVAYEAAGELLLSSNMSTAAAAFLIPLTGQKMVILKANDGLVALDYRTGEELWVFNEIPFTVGFYAEYDNKLTIANYVFELFASNEKSVFQIDLKDGSLVWKSTYQDQLDPAKAYQQGDRLIFHFYGLEVIDLNDGSQVYYGAPERDQVEVPAFLQAAGEEDGEEPMEEYSKGSIRIVDGKIFHSKIEEGTVVGWPKVNVQKIDLENGVLEWETEFVKALPEINQVTDDFVLLKVKGFAKESYQVFSRADGELIHEGVAEGKGGSIFRNRANVLWKENVFLKLDKKDVVLYDKSTFEVLKELDVDGQDVGKVQVIEDLGEEYLMICDKGLAFFNLDGTPNGKVELDKQEGAAWNKQQYFGYQKKETVAVNLAGKKMSGSIDFVPTEGEDIFIFTADAKYLFVIGKKISRLYEN